MSSILLGVHGVRVKEVNRKDYQLINSFSDQDADLYEVLYPYLKQYASEIYDDKNDRRVLEVKKLHREGRQIEGVLDSGHYGTQSDIRNLDKWKEVAYTKRVRDVDLSPFYFLFDLPEGKDRGFLVLQTTGVEGVQTLFMKMLLARFEKDYPNERLRISRLISEKLKEEMERAESSQVSFIRHRIAQDIATAVGRSGTDQTRGMMSLVVKFKGEGVVSRAVRRFVERTRGVESVLEFEGQRFQFDNVKIKVTLNGKERTVDMGHPDRMRANYDVSEGVDYSKTTGHPTFNSLSKAAKDILSDFKGSHSG